MPMITVTKTTKASPHGWDVVEYREGETYDLTERLAEVSQRDGWGAPAKASKKGKEEAPSESEPEEKSKGGAPSNKSKGGAKEKKGDE